MNQRENRSTKVELVSLQPLGNYVTPGLPTTGAVRLLLNKFKQRFSTKSTEPFIADDHHSKASAETLHGFSATTACGSLLKEIDRSFDLWASTADTSTKAVILPPCDESDVIKRWALEHQFEVLDPPSRQELMKNAEYSAPDLTGAGVLVIPQLERWFLRSQDGLHAIRALLNSLEKQDRQCVIGCNSWAWAFLSKAVKVDSLLPKGNTIVPFDGIRLHAWFSELALSESEHTINFRSTESGKSIFDISEDGALKSDYLKELAARSYGVPWVAWHLWRSSIRSLDKEQLQKVRSKLDKSERDQKTTWLAPLAEVVFPNGANKHQLLVLHALLVHGSLTSEELARVLNGAEYWNSVPGLIRAGIIRRDHENLSCHPVAYGVIRDALSTAGFSMDKL